MEFDPFMRDGPAPRHQLESDSEDDDDSGLGQSSVPRPRTVRSPAPMVRFEGQASSKNGRITLLEGEAGESFLKTLASSSAEGKGSPAPQPSGRVLVDDVTVWFFSKLILE